MFDPCQPNPDDYLPMGEMMEVAASESEPLVVETSSEESPQRFHFWDLVKTRWIDYLYFYIPTEAYQKELGFGLPSHFLHKLMRQYLDSLFAPHPSFTNTYDGRSIGEELDNLVVEFAKESREGLKTWMERELYLVAERYLMYYGLRDRLIP